MANRKQPITEELFREAYGYQEEVKTPFKTALKRLFTCTKSKVYKLLPFVKWIQEYNFKTDLLRDVIAGTMVAIMHIPHGLAYAPLGKVDPVVGFYMAVFPVIIYILLGTSKHISLGTFAVVCAMVGEVVQTHTLSGVLFYTDKKLNYTAHHHRRHSNLEVGVAMTLMVGLWQLGMGLFQVGYLNVIMSESLVSGYTSGAAIHVTTYQLKNLFGCNISSHSGVFKLYRIYEDFFLHIHTVNLITMAISLICIAILAMNEYLKIVQRKKCPKFKFSFPMELLLIVLGTLLSYFLELNEKYNVRVVGHIPTGFPSVLVPPSDLFLELFQESLVVAIVTLSVNISLARIFAKEGSYKVSSTQEFIAYGTANLFASFFQCLPSAASLSRTAMQFKMGGRSQLASVVSVLFILLILLFAGPFFSPVPYCVLSAIVVVTLRGLLKQIFELPKIWRQNTWNGIVWLGTFLSVIILDLDVGLLVGISLSAICIIFKAHSFRVAIQGRVPQTNIYLPIHRYVRSEEIPNLLVLRISGNLNYTNASHIEEEVMDKFEGWKLDHPKPANLVFDMSCVTDVDPTGAAALRDIYEQLLKQDTNMYLTDCSIVVYNTLVVSDVFKKFPKEQILASVSDAVDDVPGPQRP